MLIWLPRCLLIVLPASLSYRRSLWCFVCLLFGVSRCVLGNCCVVLMLFVYYDFYFVVCLYRL